MKNLRKKACGKTVAEMVGQCQEELLVVAEHKKREEVSTIQERLGTKCWRGENSMPAVGPLKSNNSNNDYHRFLTHTLRVRDYVTHKF